MRMNWTGGGLSRHSRNATASITQRQKQHFARARSSRISKISSRSPIKWTFFETAKERPSSEKPEADEFQSLIQQMNAQDDSILSEDPHLRECDVNFPLQSSMRYGDGQCFPIAKHVDDQGSGLEMNNALNHEKMPHSKVAESKHQPIRADINENCGLETPISLEQRRRQILCKGDWVGANIQRPIKLKYVPIINDERIGKRRRIDSDDRTHFGAIAQSRNTSAAAVSRKQRVQQSPEMNYNPSSTTHAVLPADTKNHVRISIGGRQVRAGVDSSSACRGISSQASISDVMLLDGEDISRKFTTYSGEPREQHLEYTLKARGDCRPNSSPMNDLLQTPHCHKTIFGASIKPYMHSTNDNTRRHRIPPFLDREDSVASIGTFRREEAMNHALGSKLGPSSPPGKYVSDISRQISESARKLQSKARDKARRHRQHSSRPQLLHPKPQTLRTAHVLHSPSSDGISSTVAQLGTMKPVIPPSQELEEKVWKTWILPLNDDLIPDDISGYDERPQSISPGISTIVYRSIRKDVGQLAEENDKRDEHSGESYLPSFALDETVKTGCDIETFRKEEGNANLSKQTRLNLEVKEASNRDIDYKNIFVQRQKCISLPKKLKRHENPDDAWMKFILSDNDEGEDDTPEKNAPEDPSAGLKTSIPKSSSVVAHSSNETISATKTQTRRSDNGSGKLFDGRATNIRSVVITPLQHSHSPRNAIAGSTLSSKSSLHPASRSPNHVPVQPQVNQLPHPQPYVTAASSARRIIFTRPQRYTDRTRVSNSPEANFMANEAIVHIGSTLRAKNRVSSRVEKQRGLTELGGYVHGGRRKGRKSAYPISRKRPRRDVYSLVSSSEIDEVDGAADEDDVESFGD